MPISFFNASRNFYRDHQNLSTVSQSAALGLFNLRREVTTVYEKAGFFKNKTKPDHGELRHKFLSGSGLTKGDFLQLASPDSFPDDLAILVRMSLMTNISLFEGWQAALSEECGLSRSKADSLEWPSQSAYSRLNQNGDPKGQGCTDMLTSLLADEPSTLISNSFGPALTSSPSYSRGNLDDFYICFRAWKEARNCITHGGGRASMRFIVDAQRLTDIAVRGLPPLKWFPALPDVSKDEPIDIPFKDMLAFSEVLRRIVATVDAELAQTQRGEKVFFERFTTDRLRKNYEVPFAVDRRHKVITEICTRINLPKPVQIDKLDDALTERMGRFLRPAAEELAQP